jgi:hypothetical protein
MAAAEYLLRDQEYPHLDGTQVITDSPHAAQVDDKGQFKLEVPEGRYTLKVWFRGAWVVTMPVEVGPRVTELKVDVPAQKRGKAQ